MPLSIYIPAQDSELRARIRPGSGIVGSEIRNTGRLRIDFEGNLYDSDELDRYVDRVARAAERHMWRGENGQRYHTVACAYVDPDQVRQVGQYLTEDQEVRLQNMEAVREYLREDIGRDDLEVTL